METLRIWRAGVPISNTTSNGDSTLSSHGGNPSSVLLCFWYRVKCKTGQRRCRVTEEWIWEDSHLPTPGTGSSRLGLGGAVLWWKKRVEQSGFVWCNPPELLPPPPRG